MCPYYHFIHSINITTLDLNAEIVPEVDPRHSHSHKPSDAELKEAAERKREAYLSFIADLEAASAPLIVSEDVYNTGTVEVLCRLMVSACLPHFHSLLH